MTSQHEYKEAERRGTVYLRLTGERRAEVQVVSAFAVLPNERDVIGVAADEVDDGVAFELVLVAALAIRVVKIETIVLKNEVGIGKTSVPVARS